MMVGLVTSATVTQIKHVVHAGHAFQMAHVTALEISTGEIARCVPTTGLDRFVSTTNIHVQTIPDMGSWWH